MLFNVFFFSQHPSPGLMKNVAVPANLWAFLYSRYYLSMSTVFCVFFKASFAQLFLHFDVFTCACLYAHMCEQINFTIAELFCTWAIQVREVIRIISSLACYWKKSSGLNSNFPIIVFFFFWIFYQFVLQICSLDAGAGVLRHLFFK